MEFSIEIFDNILEYSQIETNNERIFRLIDIVHIIHIVYSCRKIDYLYLCFQYNTT